jgi:hypothetical protein
MDDHDHLEAMITIVSNAQGDYRFTLFDTLLAENQESYRHCAQVPLSHPL